MSTSDPMRRTWILAGVLAVVAIAMRINNAFQYRMLFGFDALWNWVYIKYLTRTWVLPAPDAGWSTAHPPFFYYLSAALCRIFGTPERDESVVLLRLMVSAFGLAIAGLAYLLVRRLDPDNRPRALLAVGLVLFLPVHIYLSAMVTEEIVVSALVSAVLVAVCLDFARPEGPSMRLAHAAGFGLVAGLAFLTKLTGSLMIAAACFAYAIDGWRRRLIGPTAARIAVFAVIGSVVGGWYYVHNLARYGYIYPHGMEKHHIMYSMPPGERHVMDYVRVPLSTFTDPQVLNPDLLRSIWGSTYLTMWFDGHRAFLPTETQAVDRVGTLILLLALLPTAALIEGLIRGLRRALQARAGPDLPMMLLVGLTLAGYVLFTWKNPWFAVHKASFLLSLSVPYAYYTSEILCEWAGRGGWLKTLVWTVCGALVVLVTATFTFSRLFWNLDHMTKTGVVW